MTTPTDATHWLTTLTHRFPHLLTELSPGSSGPIGGAGRTTRTHAPAPLRLHVSDAIRDITDGVVELDEAVHERLGLGRPRKARVPERLARVAGLVGRMAGHPDLVAHVADEARRMAGRCARAVGDGEPMTRIGGRCPWCDSVSLRAFPDRRAVLCVNPGCRCASAGCGCGADPAYRHSWKEGGWDALAGTDPSEIAAALDTTGEGVRR
ncbi:hypothetical protein [Streptomyces sp. NPDC001889]